MNLDKTVASAQKDSQTTTLAGEAIISAIDGVVLRKPPVHVDHRGRLFELFQGVPGDDGFWEKPVVYSYVFSVRPGQVKGWGLHLEKDDRYSLIVGEMVSVLFDARLGSPTYGHTQKVVLSEQGNRQVNIPAGVWHMNVNVGTTEATLVNFPTKPYDHEAPDRLLLPWDTEEIPFRIESLFPVQA
jgi:dTDP-4-dehydrorhamnose 3,5-epimerase